MKLCERNVGDCGDSLDRMCLALYWGMRREVPHRLIAAMHVESELKDCFGYAAE